MFHQFDTKIAELYGISEAILLNYISFWIAKNKANQMNFYDGCYWTYNSIKAFTELFPYMSKGQVNRTLKHLVDEGIIITGNYNKLSYDRTLWYALTEEGEKLINASSEKEKTSYQKEEMDFSKTENGISQNGKPIPFINTFNIEGDNINNNTTPTISNNNQHSTTSNSTNRFIKPTIAEIQDYIHEKHITNVDAEEFYHHYESNGWKVGKTPMKNWKSAVQTWTRNGYHNSPSNKMERDWSKI